MPRDFSEEIRKNQDITKKLGLSAKQALFKKLGLSPIVTHTFHHSLHTRVPVLSKLVYMLHTAYHMLFITYKS